MKPDGILKHVAAAFGIALVVYIVAYGGIEHRRTRQGPWRVVFTNDLSGAPAILIDQPGLTITNVLIAFQGQALPAGGIPGPVAFDEPRPVPWDVPFGKCIFTDTTSLPGTIVFELFGHEIQLLPRVLTLDKKERPWHSNETIVLQRTPDAGFRRERMLN
ncbi:MAG: hypothetical protein ABSA69_00700 [Verrucomicrobiota bacterium]|jgi:hypothetical protein